MYAVAAGDPFDHFEFIGPFDSFEAAELWCNTVDAFTWIVSLIDPKE
jgi:hypothetical protein